MNKCHVMSVHLQNYLTYLDYIWYWRCNL